MSENTENSEIIEKNKLIYQEVSEARRRQSDSINLLNQKFNWILAIDILLIGYILQINEKHSLVIFLAFLLLITSSFLCLFSLSAKNYKQGPNLSAIYEKQDANYERFIKSLNKSTINGINENRKSLELLTFLLGISITIITTVIFLLFIYYFNLAHVTTKI